MINPATFEYITYLFHKDIEELEEKIALGQATQEDLDYVKELAQDFIT